MRQAYVYALCSCTWRELLKDFLIIKSDVEQKKKEILSNLRSHFRNPTQRSVGPMLSYVSPCSTQMIVVRKKQWVSVIRWINFTEELVNLGYLFPITEPCVDLSSYPDDTTSKRSEDITAQNIVDELESGTLKCDGDKFCEILQKNYEEPVNVECVKKDRCKLLLFVFWKIWPRFYPIWPVFSFSFTSCHINGGVDYLTAYQCYCRRNLSLSNRETRSPTKAQAKFNENRESTKWSGAVNCLTFNCITHSIRCMPADKTKLWYFWINFVFF